MNLAQEAQKRGIDPDRLVFAERMPLPEPEFQREVQHPLLGVIPSWLQRSEGVLPWDLT